MNDELRRSGHRVAQCSNCLRAVWVPELLAFAKELRQSLGFDSVFFVCPECGARRTVA